MKTITYKDFFDGDSYIASKLVELYQGEQAGYVKKRLDGKCDGLGERKNWKTRGYIPRFRNIIKPIVDKSGMLFNDTPTFELHYPETGEIIVDKTFNDLMSSIDADEFFQNVDTFTRLLKTTIVLWQQYIPEDTTTTEGVYQFDKNRGDALLPILLSRANTIVRTDFTGRVITELAYITSDDMDMDDIEKGDENWTFRYIDNEVINDYLVDVLKDKEILVSSQPNVHGFIPATTFHDTAVPLNSFWNELPEDIANMQDMYNLALTDTEFSIAWMKQKTLFVNADIVDTDNQNGYVLPTAQTGHTDAGEVYHQMDRWSGNPTKSGLGGLGSAIRLKNDDQGNTPLVQFLGPETDLKMLDDIINNLVVEVANDWSVNLKYAGSGRANSGFQLVVEELDNLNLRKKRAQFFTASFRRAYRVLKRLYPTLPDAELEIQFAKPNLPVNQVENENLWSQKIAEGRASIIDYLMEVSSMDMEAAIKKAHEIQLFNSKYLPVAPTPITTPII